MSSLLSRRSVLSLSLAVVALAGCRNGIDTKAQPQPLANGFAARGESPADDACGTYERPCVLPELRVTAAAAE